MRTVWTEDSEPRKTIEEDNRRLAAMNRVYEESKDAEEANAKIDALVFRVKKK